MLKNTVERTRKPSGNLKMEQEKLPNMSKREGKYAESQKEKRECESEEKCKEIMAEKSSNLAINVSLHIQETEQIPNRINPKKSTRHMIIQLKKTKNKIQSSVRNDLYPQRNSDLNNVFFIRTQDVQKQHIF